MQAYIQIVVSGMPNVELTQDSFLDHMCISGIGIYKLYTFMS